jgi:hypothetical protein
MGSNLIIEGEGIVAEATMNSEKPEAITKETNEEIGTRTNVEIITNHKIGTREEIGTIKIGEVTTDKNSGSHNKTKEIINLGEIKAPTFKLESQNTLTRFKILIVDFMMKR